MHIVKTRGTATVEDLLKLSYDGLKRELIGRSLYRKKSASFLRTACRLCGSSIRQRRMSPNTVL
jgi:hypothetical protein